MKVGGQLGNSDHGEIRYKIKWQNIARSRNIGQIPNFRKVECEGLKRDLQVIDKHWTDRESRVRVRMDGDGGKVRQNKGGGEERGSEACEGTQDGSSQSVLGEERV